MTKKEKLYVKKLKEKYKKAKKLVKIFNADEFLKNAYALEMHTIIECLTLFKEIINEN